MRHSWFILLLIITGSTALTKDCRCLYTQQCWPNDQAFQTLSTQLSQPLLHPVPPALACYPPSNPSGNCSDVQVHFTNGSWRSDQAGQMQNTNFETYLFKNGSISACFLNTTLDFPCEQGSVPPVGVNASSAQDVQAAINFARQYNLKLVVKNTGHDYLGRSTARGAFLLWTHRLKDTSFNSSFIPDGSPFPMNETFEAVTFGAGIQWHEAYDFVAKQDRFIVGGISQDGSVGAAGGWVMGAGHSAFAPLHGLGVDNVLQFTIVLADGSHVTSNQYQNADLFWALRGGGGGTWGVVTSATYKTHPNFPLTMAFISTNLTTPAIAHTVVSEFVRLQPSLSDSGWGGYTYFSNDTFSSVMIASNYSWGAANATVGPFIQFIREATNSTNSTDSGEGSGVEAVTLPFNSFQEWSSFAFGADSAHSGAPLVGRQSELASRLVPRKLAEENPGKAAKIMLSVDGVTINCVAGGAVSRVDPLSMGLNPSWRKAVMQVIVSASWPEGSQETEINQAISRFKEATAIIDKLTEDSGSYLNEASLHEVDFKKSFFGDHYPKLAGIKKRYDPQSLFVVPLGVASDEWDEELICRR